MSSTGYRLIGSLTLAFVISAGQSTAEIRPNTHVFAMVELDHICRGERQPTGQYVRVVIYRSNADRYYTYMMSSVGQIFESGGGRQHSTLDGNDMVSELQLAGRRITYRETGSLSQSGRAAISTLEVQINSDGTSCTVNACSMSLSINGDSSLCQYRCWPDACEIRRGPAS